MISIMIQYVAEPKVHSAQIALSTYENFNSSKKLPILPKIYLHTVPNRPNVHHVLQPKSEKNTKSTPSHPKMEKYTFRPIQLLNLTPTTNASSHMPQKLNSPTIAMSPQSQSNSVALSQRIPSIFQWNKEKSSSPSNFSIHPHRSSSKTKSSQTHNNSQWELNTQNPST